MISRTKLQTLLKVSPLFILSFLSTNCATALTHSGSWGQEPSTKQKVTAGAIDVVTLPAQIAIFTPAAIEYGVESISSKPKHSKSN
jgi:hypothetical protein